MCVKFDTTKTVNKNKMRKMNYKRPQRTLKIFKFMFNFKATHTTKIRKGLYEIRTTVAYSTRTYVIS